MWPYSFLALLILSSYGEIFETKNKLSKLYETKTIKKRIFNDNDKMYCMRTFDSILPNKLIDQCMTKKVLHVYTMDTCSILCCDNMTV